MTAAARAAGAIGACLSGAGPSILALVESDHAPAVADSFRAVADTADMGGGVRRLDLAPCGAEVIDERGLVSHLANRRATTMGRQTTAAYRAGARGE
jgi:GHMP kinases C terminal